MRLVPKQPQILVTCPLLWRQGTLPNERKRYTFSSRNGQQVQLSCSTVIAQRRPPVPQEMLQWIQQHSIEIMVIGSSPLWICRETEEAPRYLHHIVTPILKYR